MQKIHTNVAVKNPPFIFDRKNTQLLQLPYHKTRPEGYEYNTLIPWLGIESMISTLFLNSTKKWIILLIE